MKEVRTGAMPSNAVAVALKTLVESLSLLGIVGFCTSVAVNSLAFNNWGLKFLQLATVGDVLMSGLQLAIDMAPTIIAASIAFFLGAILFLNVEGWSTKRWTKIVLLVLAWPLLGIPPLLLAAVRPDLFALQTAKTAISGLLMGLIALPAASVTLNFPARLVSDKLYARIYVLILVLLFLALIATRVPDRLATLSHQGFVSITPEIIISPVIPACLAPRVLWAGERNIVVRCDGATAVSVLCNMQDVRFGRANSGPALGRTSGLARTSQ